MTDKQKNDVVGKKECTDAAARDPNAGPLPFCNDAWEERVDWDICFRSKTI